MQERVEDRVHSEVLAEREGCFPERFRFRSCGFYDIQLLRNLHLCLFAGGNVLGCADQSFGLAAGWNWKALGPNPADRSVCAGETKLFIETTGGWGFVQSRKNAK